MPPELQTDMSAIPRKYADVQGFITMLMVACEDSTINNTLQSLLSQPNTTRKDAVLKLVEKLRKDKAPSDLIEAIACLLDDDVAEKAFEAIYQCERKDN